MPGKRGGPSHKDGPLAGASLSDRGRVRHAPARYGDGGAGKRAGGPEPRNPAPAGARLQARGTECVQLDKAAHSESEKAQELRLTSWKPESRDMEFDDQMRRFFGTDNLGAVSPEGIASGIERMRVEFGLETDKGRRFAMWSLLYMLGSAPDLDAAFKDARDREAARAFMDLLDRANAGECG